MKPANFVLGRNKERDRVYMIDFGLAKRHLRVDGTPFAQQPQEDFNGTAVYASLNAHNSVVRFVGA